MGVKVTYPISEVPNYLVFRFTVAQGKNRFKILKIQHLLLGSVQNAIQLPTLISFMELRFPQTPIVSAPGSRSPVGDPTALYRAVS